MVRRVTSTPKLRINGCVAPSARLLRYAGLTSVKPPVVETRELSNPTVYDPPVGTSWETPTLATVLFVALAWNWLTVGDWLLCRRTSAVVNQSKMPYELRKLCPAIR